MTIGLRAVVIQVQEETLGEGTSPGTAESFSASLQRQAQEVSDTGEARTWLGKDEERAFYGNLCALSALERSK